jgi:hypothetical protein
MDQQNGCPECGGVCHRAPARDRSFLCVVCGVLLRSPDQPLRYRGSSPSKRSRLRNHHHLFGLNWSQEEAALCTPLIILLMARMVVFCTAAKRGLMASPGYSQALPRNLQKKGRAASAIGCARCFPLRTSTIRRSRHIQTPAFRIVHLKPCIAASRVAKSLR